MSAKFEKVKNYYLNGLWNGEMVRNAVGRWITEAEAEEIFAAERIDSREAEE